MGKWKTKSRFSTFPQPLATTMVVRASAPKNKKGSRPLRGLRLLGFHDHLALETKIDFMIILGLENAPDAADAQ
jgi:hypothetical protein